MGEHVHPRVVHPGDHLVQFYTGDEALCEATAQFLADGLAAGQPALVIALPERRQRIAGALALRGFDVGALRASGDLTLLDAETLLSSLLRDGVPDAAAFASHVGAVVHRLRQERPAAAVRAYGEMVDLLWAQGKRRAALDLEALWNRLLQVQPVSLLCGYAMHHFQEVPTSPGLEDVCGTHTHVRLPVSA